MGYKRIKEDDRIRIETMLADGKTQKEIAVRLNFSQGAISVEINRGISNGSYSAKVAQERSQEMRTTQKPKLKIDEPTWEVIKKYLEKHWTPKDIEVSLRTDPKYAKLAHVNEKTIYNYVKFHMKGELKKIALDHFRQHGKKRKSPEAETRGKIKNMTLIDEIPMDAGSREVPGYWEGDLIIGSGHKSALLVLVERQTRLVKIKLLMEYSAPTVRKSIEAMFRGLKPDLLKGLTCDQGKEMAEHEKFTQRTGVKVYFCHPHSPWEKGTVERTNFLIRDMLNGQKDFRKLTQRDISKIARLLNERPRATLGYQTPKKCFEKLMESA